MSCASHEEALALHADDALEGEEARALEAHLQSCHACASDFAALRALVGDLRAAAPRPAEPFVATTVAAATTARRKGRVARAGGLTAVGIAAAAAAWLLLAPPPPTPPAELSLPGDDTAWLAALGEDDAASEEEDELTTLGLDELDDDALDELVALAEG